MDDLAQAMGGETDQTMIRWIMVLPNGISSSQVSRLCGEIDERVEAFLTRPIEGVGVYADGPASGSTQPASTSARAGASCPARRSSRSA